MSKTPNDIEFEPEQYSYVILEGTISGMRQFLAIESPLKMTKNTFYFTSKSFFVLKIFQFLSGIFGYVARQLD